MQLLLKFNLLSVCFFYHSCIILFILHYEFPQKLCFYDVPDWCCIYFLQSQSTFFKLFFGNFETLDVSTRNKSNFSLLCRFDIVCSSAYPILPVLSKTDFKSSIGTASFMKNASRKRRNS